MTTPDKAEGLANRALELADMDKKTVDAYVILSGRRPLEDIENVFFNECKDREAILRHYAKIMQAETIGIVEYRESHLPGGIEVVVALVQPAIAGAQLIIKPAP